MAAEWHKVLVNVVGMSLVILLGWIIRKRGYLDSGLTRELSMLVVDIALPALIFVQMIHTVNWESLSVSWYLPPLGLAIMALGLGLGYLGTVFTGVRHSSAKVRHTVAYLTAMPNWVFLPLPIALALYQEKGSTIVLLYNIGFMTGLWTLGIWTLRGGRIGWSELQRLVFNPGILSTFAGILWALYVPDADQVAAAVNLPAIWVRSASDVALLTLNLVSQLTVPLSLIVVGALLGELKLADGGKPLFAPITLTLILRLGVCPLLVLAGLWLAVHNGLKITREVLMVTALIAAMPVGSSCSVFAERYGGDGVLSAKAILISTFLGILTVPAFFRLTEWAIPMGK